MSSTIDIYGERRNGISHGDVFTSPDVVRYMLDLIGYTPDKDLSAYRILEPSSGQGDFLLEIQRRIMLSARKYGFNATDVMSRNVYSCEIDTVKYDICISRLKSVMQDFNPYNLKNEDFLLSDWNTSFHYIIGNPPYVRYENIPADKRETYKSIFHTFHYRCDLYVLFFEHSIKYLSSAGKHCFICANRWLKNEYGKKLRALIATSYNLEYLIDVEHLNAFQENVLAYPAITVINNSPNSDEIKTARIDNIAEFSNEIRYITKQGVSDGNWDKLFQTDGLNRFSTIEQQGFSIGIGVATGADKVFISSKLDRIVENELLLPVINARDLSGNEFNWGGRYLLNPYKNNGELIDLNEYPKALEYLDAHKESLVKRHIVRNNRAWFSLIDRVKPGLLHQPKILLPDISGNRMIFVDEGKYYPAHNIYYITGPTPEDLYILAAILMSGFARDQISNISNKMNGAMPRWQSQSIKKLRIPMVAGIGAELRTELLNAYRNADYDRIDTLVGNIIKNSDKSDINKKYPVFPESIFDYDFMSPAGEMRVSEPTASSRSEA